MTTQSPAVNAAFSDKFYLQRTTTGKKSGNFHYQVFDGNGQLISERWSNREYVACTIGGTYYFGRLDLIGKGEHGRMIKRLSETNQPIPPIAFLTSKK
jgi:hypothetical protein